ncbi:MAG: tetratricopeptide repeat protein [Bacteroidia bacterium]
MSVTISEFKEQLLKITDAREKIKAIQNFVWPATESFPNALVLKENLELLNEAFRLAEEANDKSGLGYGYINMSFIGLHITQDPKTFENFDKGTRLLKEIGDTWGYGRALNSMAYSLSTIGRYDETLKYAFEALKHAEEIQHVESMGWANYALGVFYFDLKDYSSSEYYFKKGFDIFQSDEKNVLPTARCRSGLGSVFMATNRLDEAFEHVRLSAEGYRKINNVMGESRALNDLGVLLRMKGRYADAESTLKQSLALRENLKYYQGLITSCFELGTLYLMEKRYEDARDFLYRALGIASDIKSKPKLYQIHEMLGEVYKQTNNMEKALEHKEKFFELKTEVAGEQAANRVKHLQTQYATEKSEKETEIHRLKNVELKKAYKEIEEKNKSILDSINYARRIQQAILPSEQEMKALLTESFVLYIPKDVVSGDFYWIQSKGSKVLFAAVDCTGHGVPGAFMSMIGNTMLNEIVNGKGVVSPGEILKQLREGIIKSLKQTGSTGENQDGMDIALCSLDGNILEFAGANNPLWIISNGEFREIKADKQPIGIYYGETKPYTNHTVELRKGDCVYIFTDGYADQVGGSAEKKFKYKQLQELIVANHKLAMEQQKALYFDAIDKWKGNLEQVDDILLIGVRL